MNKDEETISLGKDKIYFSSFNCNAKSQNLVQSTFDFFRYFFVASKFKDEKSEKSFRSKKKFTKTKQQQRRRRRKSFHKKNNDNFIFFHGDNIFFIHFLLCTK